MRLVIALLILVCVGCSSSGRMVNSENISFQDKRPPTHVVTTTTTTSTSTTTTTTTPPTTTSTSSTTITTIAPVIYGSGKCGGDLPPCWIMNRESRGIITAQNPESSASGKWQILDSTWGGYGGYTHAKDAPEWVQDAKARSMALCNWQPPNYCA
jgi:hypothetical protein